MVRPNSPHRGLRRIDLSRQTGCNIETIRYYETIGLMPDPPRSPKGYRIYSNEHVSRLNFVMRARALGFTLDEIRGLLALVDGGRHSCAEVRDLASQHLENVREKIRDLRRVETVLATTIGQCSGTDAPDCPVIEALSDSLA